MTDPDTIETLRAENERLRAQLVGMVRDGGPYMLGKWTEEIRHVDPCDCDLDEENAGDECMANSEWTYAVFTDGGAFAPRLIVTLPKRPPDSPDHDGAPLVASHVL